MENADSKSRTARRVATALAFALMVAALLYLFLGNTAVAQAWRLRRARGHQDLIEQALRSDARFGTIKVGVCPTSGGAALMVQGTVAAEGDLQALKEIVQSTRPPCHVQYRVVIAAKGSRRGVRGAVRTSA